MSLSDSVTFTRSHGANDTDTIRATLSVELQQVVSRPMLESDGAKQFITSLKSDMKRKLVRMIQPNGEFESAFAEVRKTIQSCMSITMDDQMAIMKSLSELREKTLLT